jgi:hypothetical protein
MMLSRLVCVSSRVSTEELARRQGIKPIASIDELAQPDLWVGADLRRMVRDCPRACRNPPGPGSGRSRAAGDTRSARGTERAVDVHVTVAGGAGHEQRAVQARRESRNRPSPPSSTPSSAPSTCCTPRLARSPRAPTLLKTAFKALRRVSRCPWRIGAITAARARPAPPRTGPDYMIKTLLGNAH